MINPQIIFQNLISLLDEHKVEYRLFSHRPALTYEDLAAVQKETGFFGTEGKCMVLKADKQFIVYVTVQGQRINFDQIKKTCGVKKVHLASKEELHEYFGAEPGCAYPFGFDVKIDIFVDPNIYDQEWFLFSPVFSSKTVQAKGSDLKKVFSHLPNRVNEIFDWNE